MIKPNLVTDSHNFYDKYYRFEHLTYEEWRKQMTSYHSQTYLPSSILQRNGYLKDDPMQVITFMQSLPVEETSNMKGNLTVLIDETKIHEMTRQIESANGSSVYIVNQNHELISSTPGASPLSNSILNELKSNSGLRNYNLNGQDVTVSFTTSGQVGWYYIAVMPLNVYLQKVKQMEHLALWLLLLCILAGSAAAYGIAYRNYFPIKRMIEAIQAGKSHPRKPAVNEFDYILEMMKISWDEERHIKNKLTQQLPILRSNYLHRVLQGYFEPPEQMKQSLEFMGIHFPFPHFIVILVQVDDMTRFAPNQSEKQWALVRFIISNLAEDTVYEGHTIHTIDLEKDRLALLVNLLPDQMDHPACRVKDIVSGLHRMLETRFKLEISIAISGVHKGQHQIGEAYLKRLPPWSTGWSMGSCRPFTIMIFARKAAVLLPCRNRAAVNQLYSKRRYRASGPTAYTAVRSKFSGQIHHSGAWEMPIIQSCRYPAAYHGIRFDTLAYRKLTEGDIHPVRFLLSCKTTDEMFEKAKDLYVSAAESFKLERSDHNEQLLLQIQTCIQANYADPNMSLNLVSEHLQITPQYISQFFKRVSGQNFNDYLTVVRMDHAKKLMSDPGLTNAQIAKMVGYTSDTVFIRVFKKIEGITPGKYRESITKCVGLSE